MAVTPLHQILSLDRPLFVYDTETTGLDTAKDRIIEVGFQMWTREGLTKEYRTLVNPGVAEMPAKAEETHGISMAKLTGCKDCGNSIEAHQVGSPHRQNEGSCSVFRPWPTFAQLAPSLAKGFTDCDFAGKNIRYDLRITAAEMARAGQPWSYAGARVIDADRLEQLGEPRTLSHLYEKHTGRKIEGAHEAMADVRATTEVIAAQLRKYQSALPRDLDALHDLQWPGWIDTDGKFRFVDGVAVVSFGKYIGKPVSSVPPDYWQWMLKSDFPEEVRTIAQRALIGQYPRVK